MKSIQDVRRQNLNDLIDREFNGVQTRMAEKLGTQANLVNRWALGKKVIGDQVARKIEAAANKPRNWLDIDRSLSQEGFQPVGPSDIGQLAAHNLERWMSESRDLSTQGKLHRASGVAQVTISRLLNNEVSVSISTLENVASAFGRHGYELLIHPHDPATINYDRSRYALLPETEKAKIESNIKGLVAAGHEMASELKAECGAVDMRSVAKLISDLATQLEVQLVRANALAEDHQRAIESIKQADAAVKLAHEKFSALAAENAGLKHAMAVTLEHVSVTDAGQAGVAAMIINDALHHSETPATDAFLAEVRAQGVDMARNAMIDFVDGEVGPNKNVPGLIRGAEICVSIAEQLRKGGNQ
jgi:transcriptional regulator with XRE-family HTH domain